MPSCRTRPGAAPGSSEHSTTARSASSRSFTGAVAAGTISRSAIRSASAASPANGRATNTGAAPPALPWQFL